jgi:hypothetical protein
MRIEPRRGTVPAEMVTVADVELTGGHGIAGVEFARTAVLVVLELLGAARCDTH